MGDGEGRKRKKGDKGEKRRLRGSTEKGREGEKRRLNAPSI